jgi:hypothetical protein
VLIAVGVLSAGCGAVTQTPPHRTPRPVASSSWPSAADYQTIKIAAAVRDDALFHQTDWRRKSFAASLALRTLMTVRMAPGRCAEYLTELYGNLRDLLDAYPREDWRPLIQLVRRQPTLAHACQQSASDAQSERHGNGRNSNSPPRDNDH